MEIASESLEAGHVKLTIILSPDDLERIAKSPHKLDDSELSGQITGIFDTTRYCVTCTLTNEQHDVDVSFGDTGVNIKATAICSPGLYRYHDGPC